MADITTWDGGGEWDGGLEWDIGGTSSNGNIKPYIDLVTNAYYDKPKFIAMLSALLQPIADITYNIGTISPLYNVDVAVGDQLDAVGEWVGISRNITTPLVGVYFSFDLTGVGFDQGLWFGPHDSEGGITVLPDAQYRILIYAKIGLNYWNGSIPDAYRVYSIFRDVLGFNVLIQDNGDMTMYFALSGGTYDALTLALLTGGYIATKPSGVEILGYIINSVPNTMIFGFDSIGPSIGGFDSGSWGTNLTPT